MSSEERIPITVDSDGQIATWAIQRSSSPTDRTWTLELDAPDGRSWSAQASDVFKCLLILRRQPEPEAIRLCCNGARINAWASGMARDMGGGIQVYLVTLRQRPSLDDLVPTLYPAPLAEIAPTVEAQEDFNETWLRSVQ